MRYFIGFLVTIGLLIVLIVLLLSGSGHKTKPPTPKTLPDYATTDASVRLTIDGQINADQTHRQIRITVNRDDATFDLIQGYQGTVISTQSYANNESAYSNFLYALSHVGFTLGDNSKLLANEKGYCPLGNRYIFELINNGQDVQRYWATTCGKPRTYGGNVSATLNLFKLQIPDYSTLTQNVSL